MTDEREKAMNEWLHSDTGVAKLKATMGAMSAEELDAIQRKAWRDSGFSEFTTRPDPMPAAWWRRTVGHAVWAVLYWTGHLIRVFGRWLGLGRVFDDIGTRIVCRGIDVYWRTRSQ